MPVGCKKNNGISKRQIALIIFILADPVIQNLQKHAYDVNMCFFYFIKQNAAIEKLGEAYFSTELKARLTPNRRGPRSAYLLAGPPGVGKTFCFRILILLQRIHHHLIRKQRKIFILCIAVKL